MRGELSHSLRGSLHGAICHLFFFAFGIPFYILFFSLDPGVKVSRMFIERKRGYPAQLHQKSMQCVLFILIGPKSSLYPRIRFP
jgi:hypothetical protein